MAKGRHGCDIHRLAEDRSIYPSWRRQSEQYEALDFQTKHFGFYASGRAISLCQSRRSRAALGVLDRDENQ